MIDFWIRGTSSAGTSTPKSPRATMIPSATSMISSMFSTPSTHSIFGNTLISGLPFSAINFLISNTSCFLLTNEAAMKFTSCLQPKIKSFLSFSDKNSNCNLVPGTLIPRVFLTLPSLAATQ